MQLLPIGIQTFRDIIENDLLYVDKTKEIGTLIKSGKYFFISRPRRFGKSLLVSTLAEIFRGNRSLFEGLYIYDKIKWEKYPVIHISMSNLKGTKDINSINISTLLMLNNSAKENNVVMEEFDNPALMFGELINKMSKKNKVVVLIDEYDKPILDNINNLEIAKRNRDFLRDFYSVLKD
ncbi:MAG TPA: AAA family ATPase, partial [Melioribacteraceae bacterium]|nr:AAA family ATPase [Melioribacteraceae bacterium]